MITITPELVDAKYNKLHKVYGRKKNRVRPRQYLVFNNSYKKYSISKFSDRRTFIESFGDGRFNSKLSNSAVKSLPSGMGI